jgi:hypothetical protein
MASRFGGGVVLHLQQQRKPSGLEAVALIVASDMIGNFNWSGGARITPQQDRSNRFHEA